MYPNGTTNLTKKSLHLLVEPINFQNVHFACSKGLFSMSFVAASSQGIQMEAFDSNRPGRSRHHKCKRSWHDMPQKSSNVLSWEAWSPIIAYLSCYVWDHAQSSFFPKLFSSPDMSWPMHLENHFHEQFLGFNLRNALQLQHQALPWRGFYPLRARSVRNTMEHHKEQAIIMNHHHLLPIKH